MQNQRTAILIGSIDREIRNLSKKIGGYFVAFNLDCTMPHDKYKALVKIKAGGDAAKTIIEESQKGAVIKIQGLVDSSEIWKREPCDICKKEYEGVITLFNDDARVKFLSGSKSQIGDMEDISDQALKSSLKRLS